MARPAVGSQAVSAMPEAINTVPQTGGVMVDSRAYQKTKRWAVKGGRPSSCSAGPATEMLIT